MTDINASPSLPPVIEEEDSPNTLQVPLFQHDPHADGDNTTAVASASHHQPPDMPQDADHRSTDEHSALSARLDEDLHKMREPGVHRLRQC